ncbi:hypothetical protein BBP40_007951 [Aspergillus hancockii]|nr:hypothetical protein BBP40_007951 [Aspergillus hancockii]
MAELSSFNNTRRRRRADELNFAYPSGPEHDSRPDKSATRCCLLECQPQTPALPKHERRGIHCTHPPILRTLGEAPTMASWEVTGFPVQTGTHEFKSDTLDADGKMQVPVYISTKVNVKGTDDRYYSTEERLSRIELIGLGDANHWLSNGWSYSDKENPLASSASASPLSRVSGQ